MQSKQVHLIKLCRLYKSDYKMYRHDAEYWSENRPMWNSGQEGLHQTFITSTVDIRSRVEDWPDLRGVCLGVYVIM